MSSVLEQRLERVQNELDALRDEFHNYAYSVSHDLAAPFRHIDGFANIILAKHEDNFDDRTKNQFDKIIKGAELGAQIIEAQLEYSRLCTETMRVSRVDCNVLVSDTIAQLSDVIQNTKAEVTSSALPTIDGDASQLSKLFYQVIHNALHHQKSGSRPLVTIDVGKVGNGWEFCIKDNGIGITATQLERVFLVFRRAAGKNDYPGSGMGLAIAKCVVQHHGGKIWIQSTIDSGSSVLFTLQAERDSE